MISQMKHFLLYTNHNKWWQYKKKKKNLWFLFLSFLLALKLLTNLITWCIHWHHPLMTFEYGDGGDHGLLVPWIVLIIYYCRIKIFLKKKKWKNQSIVSFFFFFSFFNKKRREEKKKSKLAFLQRAFDTFLCSPNNKLYISHTFWVFLPYLEQKDLERAERPNRPLKKPVEPYGPLLRFMITINYYSNENATSFLPE